MNYTGYGAHNALLNELQDLKEQAQLRANDLRATDIGRARAQATADAYGYCQQRLMAGGLAAQPDTGQAPLSS